MKKFLLITYYWPPAGGAGVMRWAKMSKYISNFGWQPIVYTPSNGEIPVHDDSLLNEIPPGIEVVKTPIWEPYDMYKSFLGRKKKDKLYSGFINEKRKASLAQKISVFIRGNFFIPDARMLWIRPSVKFLKHYLKNQQVEAIISSGPPHSMHLIAEKIHRHSGLPWIADFRDPWTSIDFYHDLHLTWLADARHHALEKRVLKNATKVVAVTWNMAKEFKTVSGREDILVIPNGFDEADFKTMQVLTDEEFSIVHVGSMNKDRNPKSLWSALKGILNESEELRSKLRLKLIGPVDFSVRASIQEYGLSPFTSYREFIPHNEAVKLEQQAQILLLVINDTPNAWAMVPGKLYEYLGSGRPVLAIGPRDSDFARVLELTNGGVIHEFIDVEGLKARLLEFFEKYKRGELKGNAEDLQKFSRRSLAGDFAKLLSEITQ